MTTKQLGNAWRAMPVAWRAVTILASAVLFGASGAYTLSARDAVRQDVIHKANRDSVRVDTLFARLQYVETRLEIHDDSISAALRIIRQSNCLELAHVRNMPWQECMK